jgi:hypothetical protein
MSNAPQRQTILTEDGELSDIEAAPVQTAPLYCIHCGTANRHIATFCRKCGQSLDESNDIPDYSDYNSGRKIKRAMREAVINPQPQQLTVLAMIYNLLKLMIVGGVVTLVVTLSDGNFFNYVVAGLFIIVWMITEGIQQQGHRH